MPAPPNHDAITKLADLYGGPALAWAVNAALWLIGDASPLAVLGTVAALWWTIERARTERAKRRAIEGWSETDRRMWARLRERVQRMSRFGRLDDREGPG